ncbi:hypothetical protein [Aureimonas endophytica]|uniref:hypothetical protein n=1 Tax=Aureimonas endophytica TaxID=2027858 RepID=UPI0016643E50|nr:hypothetical protein [Aureimonas endophytica]
MPTIGWRDVAHVEVTGPVRFRSMTVQIRSEHVARWRDDPDGRFNVHASSADPTVGELGKFFPSL